jgi:DNA adenine methylase
MKYMGSKSRVAKYIVPVIQNHIDDERATLYIEPFVGGANVIDKIAAERRIGADINKYLVALLRYVQRGGELPPAIDREEYSRVRAVKDDFDDWYVGCVGFLASYNGKFFGGYAGTVNTKAGTVRDYYAEARANLAKQAWGGFKT